MSHCPHLFTDHEIALTLILVKSKVNRDLSGPDECKRWDSICEIAHMALGRPSIAALADMKHDMQDHIAYRDLAAAGGIVETGKAIR